jgi:hypothetical protein
VATTAPSTTTQSAASATTTHHSFEPSVAFARCSQRPLRSAPML